MFVNKSIKIVHNVKHFIFSLFALNVLSKVNRF